MPLKWRKVLIAEERYESAGVFDVDNNGILDIVSGAYWYEGPDFKKAHKIGTIRAEGEYFDDFSTIPLDIGGDGYLDFITGGWWGQHPPLAAESAQRHRRVARAHHRRSR